MDYINGEVNLRRLVADRPCPVIVACRRAVDGGKFTGSEDEPGLGLAENRARIPCRIERSLCNLVAGTRKSSLAGQLSDDLRMFATGAGPRNIRLDAEQVGASDPIGQPEPAELIEHRH